MRERRRRNYFNGSQGGFGLGRASAIIVGLGVLFLLGLLYLSQSNAIALKGYSLSELEAQKEELEAERDRLSVEANRLQSIQEIEKSLKESSGDSYKFVPVEKINYLPSSNVAIR